MRVISVLTPCYNEEDNVREIYERVREVFARLPSYRYEHLFIDNASTDGTVRVLRELAGADKNVKIIVNRRNFGHIRSPHHGMLQARGDAVVALAADLQDPPDLIATFLERWEQGFKVVMGVKRTSQESWSMFAVRRLYYTLIQRLADVELIPNATGFGLYDREFVEMVRRLDDPYPYVRGLIAEFGFECATIPYDQPVRERGLTKNNFFTLYDLAMVGITSHTKLPLRLATLIGFGLSALSLLVAVIYTIYKLVFWYQFPVGVAPLVIGLFLSFSVQLFFMGLIGEYIAVIHTRIMHRPLVVEKERINFDVESPAAQGSVTTRPS
jgi:glycosyltransferase involved in cell wall biosynthesis